MRSPATATLAWGIMKKAAELGAKVTYFSGPDGYVHDPDGVNTDEKLNFILEMRAKDPMHCKPYADKFGVRVRRRRRSAWGAKDVDVNMPSAMQNDVRMESRLRRSPPPASSTTSRSPTCRPRTTL